MKKLLITLFVMILSLPVFAGGKLKPNFDSVIRESGVDRATISVSIKDLETGKVVYSLNDKILSNPASVQKL
ncbi:MAG: D-alanyl-D-alanine carboxypeptidase, partial [bacterium]|nr:D-alanyl-D-alanine carboxypeptidase [bacterium]